MDSSDFVSYMLAVHARLMGEARLYFDTQYAVPEPVRVVLSELYKMSLMIPKPRV